MSIEDNQQTGRPTLSTRKVLLLILIVGLGVGVVAYSIGDTLAARAAQSAQSVNGSYPAYGPKWEGRYIGQYPANRTGTRLGFAAISTVNNVSIVGFNIVDSTHVSVNIAWAGSGSAPALTIVSVARGLSGSNTLSAGWGTGATVSVSMTGTGTLSSTSTCLRVLVVPLTGP